MVKDAEQFAAEDKKCREAAEAKNQAESLVHSTERQLAEHGDKVDASLKGQIESAIADLKTAIEGGDAEAMNANPGARAGRDAAGRGDLQAEAAAVETGAAGGETASNEDVVDAEFSEVNDDDKK